MLPPSSRLELSEASTESGWEGAGANHERTEVLGHESQRPMTYPGRKMEPRSTVYGVFEARKDGIVECLTTGKSGGGHVDALDRCG
jgi:hypothetical protein